VTRFAQPCPNCSPRDSLEPQPPESIRFVPAPLVVVVTLNWNQRADTLECLATLVRLTYYPRHIIVVDNGSTDGSVEAISQAFPRVEQLCNERNLGFAAGFNVGLRRALDLAADYVLVLNNDTLVAPDMLESLVHAATPSGVAAVSPVIYYSSEPERIWSSGANRSRVTLDLNGNHGRNRRLAQGADRDFISGCAMLIKRSALEAVGMFDERFFVYYEDSDYCLRLRHAGWRLRVEPGARLWHKVSRSSDGSDSPNERYWMGRSSVLFYRKHVRGWRWLVVVPWRAGSALKTATRLLLRRRPAAARAYLAGVWQGLRD
jgi:GT2 family glycosyltransferase